MDETPRNNPAGKPGPTAKPNREAQKNPDTMNQAPDGKEDRLNERAKRERTSEEIDKRIQDTETFTDKQM